jgi:hypothetical protein
MGRPSGANRWKQGGKGWRWSGWDVPEWREKAYIFVVRKRESYVNVGKGGLGSAKLVCSENAV